LHTDTSADYARNRTVEHIKRFNALASQLEHNDVDEGLVRALEARDNLFPDLDYRVYRPRLESGHVHA